MKKNIMMVGVGPHAKRIYFNYFKNVDFFSIIGYFKIVPLIFVLSISLSIIINVIYKRINKYIIKKIAISL